MAAVDYGRYTLHSIAATTNASGDVTAYSDTIVTGEVMYVAYVKNNYDNGVDFTITGETTTLSLWTDTDVNASEVVRPLVAGNLNTDGSALTAYASPMLLAERIKIVVAQGGNAKSGTFRILVRR